VRKKGNSKTMCAVLDSSFSRTLSIILLKFSLLNSQDPSFKISIKRVVTERAYENPAFVEDLVRDIAVGLNINDNLDYYRLESENFESIHNHSAYAVIENYKC
jgi:hypothetical protein